MSVAPDATVNVADVLPSRLQVGASQPVRLSDAQRREFARLREHFHGAVRVQLKPLAHAIGIAERSVRNYGNRLRIDGLEIMPASVCGRVTYDLEEVANALALSAIQPPPPGSHRWARGGSASDCEPEGAAQEVRPCRSTRASESRAFVRCGRGQIQCTRAR